MQQVDVVVLGAGAAGLMCAMEAGRRGRRVLVLDHADRVGKKILISGGGRCNFTNLHTTAKNFLSQNPYFAHSALANYPAAEFIALVERHRIPYHEKTLGQLFCDRTARDIVTMLERECAEAQVRIQLETRVLHVERTGVRFTLETSNGAVLASAVVVATGGLSIPQMGATGFGYELARQFEMNVIEPRPGLVPLTFHAEDREGWSDLSGVSTEAAVTVRSAQKVRGRRGFEAPVFREKVLITHRGLSGPAILQVSSYVGAGDRVTLDLAPGIAVFGEGERETAVAAGRLRGVLPGRWAERWVERYSINDGAGRLLSNARLEALEAGIHAWEIQPAGSEGFAKAEVTVGGVDTAELAPKTMEARRVRGLFFVGEVVDVTGWLGGYNFQWAWASGVAAGRVC